MSTNAIQQVGNVAIDYEAVLKTLNLNPTDPKVQALVLVCQQYELDPVLKHMVLIQGAAYITHKGLWHMAHRSGLLDGEDIVAQAETDKEWTATVSIYRKDWNRPITMTGRYPKSATNKQYGPEMAVTRAECLVLRRMFDVAVPVQEEINWPVEDRGGRPEASAVDGAKRVEQPSSGARSGNDQPALPPHNPTTGEILDVATQPAPTRSFAPPGQRTTADNTRDLMRELEEPFKDAESTLAPAPDVRDLMKTYGALDADAKAAYDAAITEAGVSWPKSPKAVLIADYAKLYELMPEPTF